MKILSKTNDGLKRCYKVLITTEELEKALSGKLQETAKKVRLDGFRPGKVPVDVVKRMYGESLKSDAKKTAITDSVKKIIKDEKLAISFNYATNIEKEDEKGVEFAFKFELVPSFELKDTSKLEIEKHFVEVTDKEADEVLESIRKETKNWVEDKSAKKVAEGQKVVIDLCIQSDIKKHKNDEAHDLEIVIGDKSLVDDFWKHLVGAKISEEREFQISYPSNFGDKSLAGKKVKYKAVIKKILKAVEHKLDNEFAKCIGYEDLKKAKAWAKSHAVSKYDYMTKDIMKRDLLDKMSDMYDFDVPQNMIDVETADVTRQLSEEAKKLGKEFTPKIQEECRKIAEKRVRLGFVIAEIAKKEKISVSKNEVNQAIKNIALMYPGHEKSIVDMYSRNEAVQAIVGPILESKVITFLLNKIKIKEKKCSIEELVALDEEPFEFFDDSKTSKTKKPAKKKEETAVDGATKKKAPCKKKKAD